MTERAYRIFISHTGKDRAWAEWARWHLETAGYPTELDTIDWTPGTNFIEAMHVALRRTDPMLVLLSAAYLELDKYTTDEWTARFAQRRRDRGAQMIPVRVENVDQHDGIWAPIVTVDVFDLPPDQAATALLEAVRRALDPAAPRTLSAAPPSYPGRATVAPLLSATGPRPPGSLPAVWNAARRNPGFTGRDEMLNRLHDTLSAESRVAVQALHGTGGVGKTQLALEYAHRFAGEYDLVWWIPSEQPELIGGHLAALAVEAGLVSAETVTPAAVAALRAHLRRTSQWLLVFDNAEDRDQLRPWLPDGPGHVVVTSRNPVWAGVARPVDVDVFSRGESVALLRTHLPQLSGTDAGRLADALGDLPLAIGQAAELLAETHLSVDTYLTDLHNHAADLLRQGPGPAGYPEPYGAAVVLAAERLAVADPAARQLITLCAHLGPEPIPAELFTARPSLLPKPLAQVAERPVAFARATARLARYGLARATETGPLLHRLTHAILRDTDPDAQGSRRTIERLLTAAGPGDGTDPLFWPRWTQLLPHILAADPAGSDNRDLRRIADQAVAHLTARGDATTALPLAEHLHAAWNDRYGPDESTTLSAAATLAVTHFRLGHYQQSCDLNEDILIRERRVRGADHSHTLTTANNLAANLYMLGRVERARELYEDTLTRRRRVLGPDHPDTLHSIANLAINLRALGDQERARRLDEEALARRRRTLGPDHPDTLHSVATLAVALDALGQRTEADQLAIDLDALGQHTEAEQIRQQLRLRRDLRP